MRNDYLPICPKCGFHAEMYFGRWQMCEHQRQKEKDNAILQFVLDHIRVDYSYNYSCHYELVDGTLTAVPTHQPIMEEAECLGLFCEVCGGTEIDQDPIQHAIECMENELNQKEKERLAEQQQETTDYNIDRADEQELDRKFCTEPEEEE